MTKQPKALGIEINPRLVGVLFTEKLGNTLRLFCYYVNGEISQFDAPAEENEANVRALFSTLNLEDTCTSLILDEVVQGRVYVQNESGHWLYTLLKATSDTLPPLNSDLGELPWQVIWRSQEVEVLHYGQLGDPEHCFALRSHISESDATRLIQNSKAFRNPVSIPRKKVYRRPYLKIVLTMLAAVGLVAASVIGTLQFNGHAAVPLAPTVRAAATVSPTAGCFLLYKRQISGPYPVKVVADLNAGGLLDAETLCRPENSADWIKLSDLPSTRTTK